MNMKEVASDNPTTTSNRHLLRHLWPYFTRHPKSLAAACLLYPANALCVILPPYLLKQILDQAIAHQDMVQLSHYAIFYLTALLLEYTTGFASEWVMSLLGQQAMRQLRTDLFAHVQRLPIAFFDRNPTGRILTRLTSDVEALGDVFSMGAITIIADLLTIIAVIGMMLWLNVKMTLLSFCAVPVLILLASFFQRYARRAYREIRRHIARINTFLAEHINAMSMVQVFEQQKRTQKEFEQLNQEYRDANQQAILIDAALYSVVEAIGTIAVAILIGFGARSLSTHAVSAGTLIAFIQYVRRFFVPIRDLSTKYTILQSAFAAAERTASLLQEPLSITSPQHPKPIHNFQNALELQHVWFSYKQDPQEQDWVLKDINLRIQRNECIALVGSTGSGKSTLLKLLNRFYDVQRGQILLDGTPLQDIALPDLRQQFAVVLQDVHFFSGSIMQNLTLSGTLPEQQAIAAIAQIQAQNIIERLPNGYDSVVQDLGNNFSAGERQVLSFARALAFDPNILILDEATSNIDAETERRIQSALDVLLKGRTSIIVAHRLSTIQKADKIVVLQHGQVAQIGSHHELMQQPGLYRDLVAQQFHLQNTSFTQTPST